MNARITIDGTSALAQSAGIGRLTRGLLNALARLDDETRYTVAYMAPDAQHSPPALGDNFSWRPIPFSLKQSAWLWQRLSIPLPVTLWTGRTALYHATDYLLPPLWGTPGIVTIHDLSFEVLPDVHHPRLRALLRRAVPRSIARARHVFADSESTKREIVRHYGTEPDKISVVYPAVEPRFRVLDRTSPIEMKELGVVRATHRLRGRFILTLGTLEPRKNLATAIRAFARYLELGGEPMTLAIAGGGGWLGQREMLEQLATDLGVSDRVRFLGFVEDQQLPALLNQATMLVYPSLYEGFGFPVLEALACGCPVITARNTSLPEAGGDAARYIDEATDHDALADEMRRVIEDETERRRMVADGLQHARRFTWDATARRVLKLYADVLDQHN